MFKGGSSFNKQTNKRISALVPVHVFGNAVDLEKLLILCKERNIPIVEDAAESLGTRYTRGYLNGLHTGTVGLLGCISFNGNKIITTGGGGMILTNDDSLAEKARYLTTQAKDDAVHYIHDEVGYNYRLTNIQAAVGVAQLENLPRFIEKKTNNYKYYKLNINKIDGLNISEVPPYACSNNWMHALQIDKKKYSMDRDTLYSHFLSHGVETRPVWYLNHLQKMFKRYQSYKIVKAKILHSTTLNIPCSVGLNESELAKIVALL